MEIEFHDEPMRFQLFGLSALVPDRRYGETGVGLMDQMWKIVWDAGLKTTGINHWVYFVEERMFVGVEVADADREKSAALLEPLTVELSHYAKHVYVGPYQGLPAVWQALKAELAARGESITMPSLEVYDHACEDPETQPTTTILLGLK